MKDKMTEEEMLQEIERLKQIGKEQDKLLADLGEPPLMLETDSNGTIIIYTDDKRAMRGWGEE